MSQQSKEFKVFAVSDNRNSFGLFGMFLIAKDGEVWQVGANDLNKKKVGDILHFVVNVNGNTEISRYASNDVPCYSGFEIPQRMENAPPSVVEAAWNA